MRTRLWIAVGIGLLFSLFICLSASAQLPTGTVNSVTAETCPTTLGGQAAGWVTQTSGGHDVQAACYYAIVSCPNMPDLGVTYGVSTPSSASNGTVAFVSASGGTTALPGNAKNDAPFDLFHAGFQIVQFAWDSDWQMGSTAGSLKVAACRVATFLSYVDSQYYLANPNNTPTAGMCAHSQSGGGGGLAFSLTYYGISSFLDKAVFVSGPQYGDMVQGCWVPNYPEVDICAPQNGVYPMGCNSAAADWMALPTYVRGQASTLSIELARHPVCNSPYHRYNSTDMSELTATSLIDGASDASYNYPQTAISAWECDDDWYWQNPTEAQGWIYLSQFNNPSQVAQNCNYAAENTLYPTACLNINRVYGCTSQELAASGYVCNGTTCPVCTGNPPTGCTCGGVACKTAIPSFAMPGYRDEDYEDPVNGCINRHTASRAPLVKTSF